MSTSPRSRPRRVDAERNRDTILAAARKALTESHATYVSMTEIARRAGVGVGTVYRNYPSRRQLLEAVFTDEVDRVCAQARAMCEDTPGEAFFQWLRSFFTFARSRTDVAVELISEIGLDTPLFRSDRARFCAAGQPLLEAAQAAGECGSRLDIGQILDALVWLARGPADNDHVQPIVDVFFKGLKATQ